MLAAKKIVLVSLFNLAFGALSISLALLPATGHASNATKKKTSLPSQASDPDKWFLSAKEAARLGDMSTLEQAQGRLTGYPLIDYVDYWQWRAQLTDSRQTIDNVALQAWLNNRAGTLVADLLRRDWLLRLGKQGDWSNFKREYAQWILRDDRDALCYGALSQLNPAEGPTAQLAKVVRTELNQIKDLPAGCQTLLREGLRSNLLNTGDVLDVIRLLFANNRWGAASQISDLLADYPTLNASALQLAYDKPVLALRQAMANLNDASARELSVLALLRMAKDNPDQAAQSLSEFDKKLSQNQRNFAWGQIGMAGMKRLQEAALGWYLKGQAQAIGAEALEWRVRAALRGQRWEMVRESIEAMSETQRQDPAWVYWLARAYAAQGQTAQAQGLYQKIAGQFNFYGKLALEELGQKIQLPPLATPMTPAEFEQAQNNPALLRALKFYALDLRFEGNREWNFALRGMNDRQLLAAAEFARRQQIYDRAINTADRTINEHDFSLRFLTPYRSDLADAAQRAGLDQPYVYGLIRQESRFINTARSGVGASGLMQLMPATAKLVAKKLGWADYHAGQVNDIGVNLALGTTYLRMVLDGLDQSPVLAAAGYNAGPGRPRAWSSRFHFGKPMEGAIFAETIPFTETRDYVKKVMSNAVYYASLLEGRTQSLKARLGMIQPRGEIVANNDEP